MIYRLIINVTDKMGIFYSSLLICLLNVLQVYYTYMAFNFGN